MAAAAADKAGQALAAAQDAAANLAAAGQEKAANVAAAARTKPPSWPLLGQTRRLPPPQPPRRLPPPRPPSWRLLVPMHWLQARTRRQTLRRRQPWLWLVPPSRRQPAL